MSKYAIRSLSCLTLVVFVLCFVFAKAENLSAGTTKYNWQQHYYGFINGKKSLLFSREMRSSKIAFADIDGDGDKDLFLGQANGELAFFENKGTNIKPSFELVTQQYKAIFEISKGAKKVNVWNNIDVGERSSPSLVDIDSDGDFDLFIGSAEGRVWYFENQGNNLIPVFKLNTSKFQGINVGRNSVPIFQDVNLQRKYDMLVGTLDGKVWLFMNEGTRKRPIFTKNPPQLVVSFDLESHAAPGLIDWDHDGDLDLVVGQKNGTLDYFENTGNRFNPKWELKEKNFQLIDIGGESAPVFIDMDGDNEYDLILGSANPTVYHYENRIQGNKRIFWNRSSNLLDFMKLVVTGSRASIAMGDLDGDGDLDMIIGEKTGNLNYFENQSKTKEPNWVLQTEEIIYMTGLENSAPALGDLDGDGDLDLIVGEKQGQVAYVENIGTPKKPEWALKDKTYFKIDVGSNSVPRLIDIDEDKDLDLLIGNFTGRVILFLNKGTQKEPQFVLESTRFAAAKVQKNSVPDFFDWNNDKKKDLILGGEEGKTKLFLSPGTMAKDTLNWEADETAMADFNVDILSHPFFADYDGDKMSDLMIGNDEGDFLLYLNKGVEDVTADQKVEVDNSIDQKTGSLVVEEVEGSVELDIKGDEQGGYEGDGFDDEYIEDESFELAEQAVKRIKIDPQYVRDTTPLVHNPQIAQATPTLGDLDQDGDMDMLVGSKSGEIYYYVNEGHDTVVNFILKSNDFVKINNIKNSAPKLIDLDQDGDLDLIVGSQTGKMYYFSNQGTMDKPNFVEDKELLKKVLIGTYSKPSVMDLNNDGIMDLLIGNLSGKLVFVRNDSNRFSVVQRDYSQIDVGVSSAPVFADLNNSDTYELLVGSDTGKLHIYRNQMPDLTGKWEELPDYGGRISPPKGISPAVEDIDNDGDLDLILGTDSGDVILYRNDAIIRESEAVQQTAEIE
ncbi:MAG: FG-GAP-like repeat-containing protein [Deltaproteobacteria bacterium]|nr:FG-GAP-like repeat-containing protein [Deltaproteobacteria bacterium]